MRRIYLCPARPYLFDQDKYHSQGEMHDKYEGYHIVFLQLIDLRIGIFDVGVKSWWVGEFARFVCEFRCALIFDQDIWTASLSTWDSSFLICT
jgi:hypothetical protein